MTQETISSGISPTQSFPLADALSPALIGLVEEVQPGIVQVRRGDRGAGTGIIWRADGYVITNHHVVAGNGNAIQVLLTDGRSFEAKVIEHNPTFDLALLKIAASDLKAIPAGDSARLRVGELVFAIGHPWGQRGVVTAGVFGKISEVKMRGSDETLQYIQSDVAIAPGNSGGPLLNADGEFIGINAMIFGGDLAVSIPSNVVSAWIAGLPKRQVTLGIEAEPIELPAHTLPQDSPKVGLMVIAPKQGEESLLIGDIIVAVDDKALDDVAALLDVLARKEPADIVELRLIRGGTLTTINIMVRTLEQA
ncbi:MAG TPA: trypsin-like peptidase domain-containing protein [Ktedonobacteraceae bacterium]|nr:trypsin-like peptidase domain-containing protein [Ktedonobacteraceae bacterium]